MADTQPAPRELRAAPISDMSWRDSGNGVDLTLEGHAAVFDEWSEELSVFGETFRERIAPGAFDEVLAETPDVRLLWNHDPNFPLARTSAGNLELTVDDTGLRVWARVAPTSYAKDLRTLMGADVVTQMSFAFSVGADEWVEDEEAREITRTITRVSDLYEASPVTFAAYPQTDVAMRAMESAMADARISPRAAAADPPGSTTAAASTIVVIGQGDTLPAPPRVEDLTMRHRKLALRAKAAQARTREHK